MSSWLRLINTQAADSQFTVRVFGYDSEIASETVQVPAHGALDLPLHDAGRFNTQINTYGRISISGDSFAAHTLRVRAAGDSFDFIVPVAVR